MDIESIFWKHDNSKCLGFSLKALPDITLWQSMLKIRACDISARMCAFYRHFDVERDGNDICILAQGIADSVFYYPETAKSEVNENYVNSLGAVIEDISIAKKKYVSHLRMFPHMINFRTGEHFTMEDDWIFAFMASHQAIKLKGEMSRIAAVEAAEAEYHAQGSFSVYICNENKGTNSNTERVLAGGRKLGSSSNEENAKIRHKCLRQAAIFRFNSSSDSDKECLKWLKEQPKLEKYFFYGKGKRYKDKYVLATIIMGAREEARKKTS